MDKIQESFVIDEGTDIYGTRTRFAFDSTDQSITKVQTYDGSGLADACTKVRNATSGERWGEGKHVATIPMAVYGQALAIKDNQERQKFLRKWLRENPAFITFDKYMK